MLGSWSLSAIGDYGDLDILSDADDIFGIIPAQKAIPETVLRLGYEDLCHMAAAAEFNHCLSDVAALQNLSCDLQVSGEEKMPSHGFSLLGWQLRYIANR